MSSVINDVAQKNVVNIINGAVAANEITVSNAKIGVLNLNDNSMKNTASDKIFTNDKFDKTKSDRLNKLINMTNDGKESPIPIKELGFSVFGVGNTTNSDEKKKYETNLKTSLNLKEGIIDNSKNEIKTSVKNAVSQINSASCQSFATALNTMTLDNLDFETVDILKNNMKAEAVSRLKCAITQNISLEISTDIVSKIDSSIKKIKDNLSDKLTPEQKNEVAQLLKEQINGAIVKSDPNNKSTSAPTITTKSPNTSTPVPTTKIPTTTTAPTTTTSPFSLNNTTLTYIGIGGIVFIVLILLLVAI